VWFGASAVTAIAAVAMTRAHVAALEATRPDVGPPAPVLVASADLTRGLVLGEQALRLVDLPSTLVPPGTVSSIERATGRVLVADLAEGEVLTETRLAGAGSGPIAALVPPGLRAFVLPSGPPAGTIRPGDVIDVLATYGANGGRPYTETVASTLEVIDVVDDAQTVGAAATAATAGPPVVVVADALTVERLARAGSLALLSISIVGDDAAAVTDTFDET
jgi:Flp pilus assembly protein CpaB